MVFPSKWSAWRHVIASGLNIAICSAGTADDAGMKMLAVVPLSGYTVIGDPNENGGKIYSSSPELTEYWDALTQGVG